MFSTSSVFIFSSCEEIEKLPKSTWDIVQEKIITPSCSNCHVTGSMMTKQSGLDLSQDDSYSKLVGVPPKNISAKSVQRKTTTKKHPRIPERSDLPQGVPGAEPPTPSKNTFL